MSKSYKLAGTGNYIDASGVAYNKTALDTVVGATIKNITRSGTTFTATKTNGTTFTFTQQDNDTKTTVTNNLTSTSTTAALSAAQGKALNDKITGTLLYENHSGNSGTVTLSKACSNFNSIEVEWVINHGNMIRTVTKILTNKNRETTTHYATLGFVIKDASQDVVFVGGETARINASSLLHEKAREFNTVYPNTKINDVSLYVYHVYGFDAE